VSRATKRMRRARARREAAVAFRREVRPRAAQALRDVMADVMERVMGLGMASHNAYVIKANEDGAAVRMSAAGWRVVNRVYPSRFGHVTTTEFCPPDQAT
jgi:hypothetical protein